MLQIAVSRSCLYTLRPKVGIIYILGAMGFGIAITWSQPSRRDMQRKITGRKSKFVMVYPEGLGTSLVGPGTSEGEPRGPVGILDPSSFEGP